MKKLINYMAMALACLSMTLVACQPPTTDEPNGPNTLVIQSNLVILTNLLIQNNLAILINPQSQSNPKILPRCIL